MATQASLDLVQKLYVAYYGRPADPAGQQYWAEQIDEQGVDSVINFFGTSPEFDARFGSMSNEQLVNNLYFQLFGRSAEPEGLAFYAGHLDAGNLTLAEIALTIATGAQNEDVAALNNKLAVAQSFTNAIDDPNEITAYQGNDAANSARQFLVNVDENTDASAVDVEGFLAQLVRASGDPSTQNVFTLTELPSQTETTLYWGDIEADTMLAFLQDVANLDLVKLVFGEDSDATVEDLDSVIESINISDTSEGSTININTADGGIISADAIAEIGKIALLAAIILPVNAQDEVTQNGIVLTTTQNNGGAFESGYTTNANDLIVAGRPELLHGAYIDGGGGYNTLEVDMKGFFAQPFQLLNIQEVHVQNMPNVYDLDQTILAGVLDRDDDFSANFPLPNLPEGADSVLDLSRARDLEKVVVNESGNTFGGLTGNQMLGILHIAGIKGDAVVRLEGNFHQEVNLYYGRGLGDAVELELANVTMRGSLSPPGDTLLNLQHNAGTVNLLSEGRLNVLQSVDFGDFLRELNISGSGELVIDDALEFAFGEVNIDASANTGGIRLKVDSVAGDSNLISEIGFSNELSEVTIKGSQARDVIEIAGTADGVYLDIDMGAGRDTLILDGVDAGRGSKIAGSELTLHIMNDVDLDLVNIDDVTVDRVVLHAGSELTLNQEQFAAWGGVLETNHRDTAEIEVIISEDTSLSELMTGFDLDSNIKLNLIVEKGATLTLTAEELHKYVALEGIDANMDGHLVITDAGLGFRVTDQSDYATGGTLANYSGSAMQNITIERDANGYERPAKDQNTDTLTIVSDGADPLVIDEPIETQAQTMTVEIIGDQDVIFEAPMTLGENFTVDFSQLQGTVSGLTIKEFENITTDPVAGDVEDWGQIIGNGEPDTRINIELSENAQVGFNDNAIGGFKSEGVAQYVVTNLNGGSSQVWVCDTTKDVEVLGLQGNGAASLTFGNVKWDHEILLEGDGAENWNDRPKADGTPDESNIGNLTVDYHYPGAPAVVNINNQGQALGVTSTGAPRPLVVASLTLVDAASAAINVEDGNVDIRDLAGDFEELVFTSDFDVAVGLDDLGDQLTLIDGGAVAGDLVLNLSGTHDFSEATLIDIDGIVLNSILTLNADQVVEFGAVISDPDDDSTLHVVELAEQALDLSAIDVGNIGDVTTADVDGTIVLDAALDFGGADSLTILAEESDTQVEMTAAQYKSLGGTGTVSTVLGADAEDFQDGSFNAVMVITDLSAGEQLNFSGVQALNYDVDGVLQEGVNLTVRLDGVIATADDPATLLKDEQMKFVDVPDEAVLEVASGDNDLTLADGVGDFSTVNFTGDGTLTLTAQQVAAIGVDNFSAMAGVDATLNITDYDGQALDLNEIQDAGINIGTITLANPTEGVTDTITFDGTLGGADEIVTVEEGDIFALTAEQLQQMADGTISGPGTVNLTALTNDQADIDLSNVSAVNGTITLLDTDVVLVAAADLGEFSVTLEDQGSTLDDLAGQTIRFATAVQAERDIIVDGSTGTTNGTNVVWLFDAITDTAEAGKIDTAGYDSDLGRLWVNDQLVDGANVEELFTSLNGNIIVRVVNTADLDELLPQFSGVARTVEIESFTQLPGGLVFNDEDLLEGVTDLRIDLGGEVSLGELALDNVLGAVINPDDADFNTLTINSRSADAAGHYLLPEDWEDGVNPLPAATNTIGNISSGAERNQLFEVVLDTGDSAQDGADLEVDSITFSGSGNDPVALTVGGNGDVTIERLDLTDPSLTSDTDQVVFNIVGNGNLVVSDEIVIDGAVAGSESVINTDLDNDASVKAVNYGPNIFSATINNDGDGDLVITGGSDAMTGDNLQSLTLNAADGDITVGSEDSDPANNFYGIEAGNLETLTTDGTRDVVVFLDAIADEFTYTNGAGGGSQVWLDNVTLAATGDWTFNLSGTNGDATLGLTDGADFSNGGDLTVNGDGTILIQGEVDLTQVNLTVTGTVDIVLAEGATLTLTPEQLDDLAVTFDVLADDTTIVAKGEGDLTALNISDADELEMTGDTVLNQTQYEQFAAGDAIDIDKAGNQLTVELDNGGDISEVDTSVVDVLVADGQNTVTLAQLAILIDDNGDPVDETYAPGYALNDTWANLSDPANQDAVAAAASYEISDYDDIKEQDLGNLTPYQAAILVGADNFDAGDAPDFTVEAPWAEWQQLIADATDADPVAIAENALETLLEGGFVYDITDLDTADLDDLSVIEAAVLNNADNYAAEAYSVSDDASQMFDGTSDNYLATVFGVDVADIAGVTGVDDLLVNATEVKAQNLSVVQHIQLDADANLVEYTLNDIFAALAGAPAVVDGAESYIVSDIDTLDFSSTGTPATVEEAILLTGAENFADYAEELWVSDVAAEYFTAAGAFQPGVQAALDEADNVAVTDPVNAAEAETLALFLTLEGDDLSYDIDDDAAEIAAVIAANTADVFKDADSITHQGLGDTSDATGTDDVQDIFVFDASNEATTIGNFEVVNTAEGYRDVLDFSGLGTGFAADAGNLLQTGPASATVGQGEIISFINDAGITDASDATDVADNFFATNVIGVGGDANQQSILTLHDGTDTFVWHWDDSSNNDNQVDAGELTLLGILDGVDGSINFSVDNFA